MEQPKLVFKLSLKTFPNLYSVKYFFQKLAYPLLSTIVRIGLCLDTKIYPQIGRNSYDIYPFIQSAKNYFCTLNAKY